MEYLQHANIVIDKKIGYYNDIENKIDKMVKKIMADDDFVFNLLLNTQDIIKVKDIKPIELSVIYDIIFSKYCPNFDIKINNLYLNDIYNQKEHFILISYNNRHYSFNYKKNSFIEVDNHDLITNFDNNKIGLYLDEHLSLPNYQVKEI